MNPRLLRWAAAILMTLSIGHLLVSLLIDGSRAAEWVREGLWATVPLMPEQTVDSQATVAAFWGGFGSFGVPLALLAGLVWHLAGRGVPVPAWVGWAIAGWCVLGGVMLVPSPYFVGVVPGALIVVAAGRQSPLVDAVPRHVHQGGA